FRWATAWRIAAGPTTFLRADRSTPPCRAWRPRADASACRSRLPGHGGAGRPTRSSRRTWLSGVDRALRHAVLARQFARFGAGLVLPQDPDDLLFSESRSFHSVRPFKGRTLAPRGGNSQGHVTACSAPAKIGRLQVVAFQFVVEGFAGNLQLRQRLADVAAQGFKRVLQYAFFEI